MTPEDFEQFTEITPDMFKNVEADTDMVKRLIEIGRRLG
jgi:hypothetical protein